MIPINPFWGVGLERTVAALCRNEAIRRTLIPLRDEIVKRHTVTVDHYGREIPVMGKALK